MNIAGPQQMMKFMKDVADALGFGDVAVSKLVIVLDVNDAVRCYVKTMVQTDRLKKVAGIIVEQVKNVSVDDFLNVATVEREKLSDPDSWNK